MKPCVQQTIVFEGNIGVGKSSCANACRLLGNVEVIPEPVERWRDFGGHNLLGLMYDDPKRWSYLFQTAVQTTCIDLYAQAPKATVRLFERSLYSAQYCFAETMYRQDLMLDVEKSTLDCTFQTMMKRGLVPTIHHIIYLRAAPCTVYKRIQTRNRPEEKRIPLIYLERLHESHDRWLHEKHFPLPAPVTTIDASGPLEDVQEQCRNLIAYLCTEADKGPEVVDVS